MIPDWYGLFLLALAAYRTWRLIGEDTILEPARDRLFKALGGPDSKRAMWASDLITCPWCLGAWLSVGWWAAWWAWPHGTLVAATPFAVSALVGGYATAMGALQD